MPQENDELELEKMKQEIISEYSRLASIQRQFTNKTKKGEEVTAEEQSKLDDAWKQLKATEKIYLGWTKIKKVTKGNKPTNHIEGTPDIGKVYAMTSSMGEIVRKTN